MNLPEGRSLSRNQLTAVLILVTLIPFSLVVFLYTTFPAGEDPTLRAAVNVLPRAWPNDTADDARLLPSVSLTNTTDEPWGNVSLSINGQFHFYFPHTVDAHSEAFVPLEFFQTKGSQFFSPGVQELKMLTIYAQLPSGARAILELPADELPHRPSTGEDDAKGLYD